MVDFHLKICTANCTVKNHHLYPHRTDERNQELAVLLQPLTKTEVYYVYLSGQYSCRKKVVYYPQYTGRTAQCNSAYLWVDKKYGIIAVLICTLLAHNKLVKITQDSPYSTPFSVADGNHQQIILLYTNLESPILPPKSCKVINVCCRKNTSIIHYNYHGSENTYKGYMIKKQLWHY